MLAVARLQKEWLNNKLIEYKQKDTINNSEIDSSWLVDSMVVAYLFYEQTKI